MAITQADVDAWVASNPDATPDQIAEAATAANVPADMVAKAYNVTPESVSEGLEAYKSGGSAADVTYTPTPPSAMDAYKALEAGDEAKARDLLNQSVGLTPEQIASADTQTPPATPVTTSGGYTLTPEETSYRTNLPTDQQAVYDLLLDNKGKSNEEITKSLVEQGISIDKAFAVVGITDPTVQAPFKVAYRKAQAEAGQNPSFDPSEYDAYMAKAKAIVDSGALTEAQAYENMLIEMKRLREEGYSITDEELANSINKAFGQTLTPEDVTNFIAGLPEEPQVPLEPEIQEELGALDALDGTPVESSVGSIVPGTPQVGEVNILDFMGLQASQPTLPTGTKLETQIEELDAEAVGTELGDISTADKTKLDTETDAILSSEIEKVGSMVEGTYTVPGQVTIPSSEGITTDLVTEAEFTEAGVPSEFIDPVTGKLRTDENLATMTAKKSYTDIDDEATAFTAAKQELAEVDPLATVTGQLAILQEQFADGNVPVWAQGAFRQVNALIAQRGIGGSTMAAEAITNALMQSAIPIAQQDASFYQNVTLQNLSNEQAAEMAKFNARTAAIFNDQAAVNAARNLNTQSENELTQFFAQLATNVSVTNAEMSNAMEQFNATAENQMTQFFEELELTAETFNADAVNELAQFDAEQANIIAQFNASMKDQREQFNVQNQLLVDASNVNWRRDVNTANTSATNAALQFDAQNLLGIQQTALNNIWQHYDTLLNFAFQAEESDKDRAQNLLLTTMSSDLQRQIAEEQADSSLVSDLVTGGVALLATDSGNSVLRKLGVPI